MVAKELLVLVVRVVVLLVQFQLLQHLLVQLIQVAVLVAHEAEALVQAAQVLLFLDYIRKVNDE